jgi:drug/metabolite transporter (DMT)-like permease
VSGRILATAIVANLIGGTSYVLTKVALGALTETTLVVVRTVVALGVLVPLGGAGVVRMLRTPGADRRRLFVMACVGYALPLVLGSYGLRRSTATSAALLIGMEPLSVVVLGTFFLGEPLTRVRVAALALGIAGATLLVLRGAPSPDAVGSPIVGNLLLAAHGAAWGVYTVAGKPLVARHDPLAVSAASLAVALPCLVPLAWAELPGVAWEWHRLAPSLAAAVTLGLGVSGLMTVLWNVALRGIEASSMAGFIFLQPLAGAALGVFALGDPLDRAAIAGGTLVLVAVWLVVRESRTSVAQLDA